MNWKKVTGIDTTGFHCTTLGVCLLVQDMKVSPIGNFVATLRQLCGNAVATWGRAVSLADSPAKAKTKTNNKGKQDRARQNKAKQGNDKITKAREAHETPLVLFGVYHFFFFVFCGSLILSDRFIASLLS